MNKKQHPWAYKRLAFICVLAILTLIPIFAYAASGSETVSDSPIVSADDSKISHRLVVELQSPPAVEWARATRTGLTEAGRVDVRSAAIQNYVNGLRAEQQAFISTMRSALPSASVATYISEAGQEIEATAQLAINTVSIDPGTTPLHMAKRQLEGLDGVAGVYYDYAYQPTTYTSMGLINAPVAWAQAGGQDDAGAGVKFATMDGGAHHDAAMFDGTGFDYPADFPPGGLGDTANNNGKIIASRAYFRPWDPPSAGDENTWPGTNGTSHGTHTASTAAGNRVDNVDFLGATIPSLTGVAPGAWIMSYRVFYNSITNDGSFYTTEGIAALEDIVADGADVVNNSWGGGPSTMGGVDPLDKALLNTYNAGVFVSMSAGNAGPELGTGDHASSEYINVAASTTDGTYAAGRLNVIAPTPIDPNLQGMGFAAAGFGAPLVAGNVFSYTYLAAANVDAANFEGCNPFPANAFAGHAAIISRGACEFGLKVLNAENAGAEFVVVHNHATGGDALVNMAPGVNGGAVTISSIFVGNTNGLAIVDWETNTTEDAILELDLNAYQAGNTPDVIAGFSSRGPGVGNTLKPDIAAPGVNIVAQGYGPGPGEARHTGFGQVSGTSMASPHVAGTAALLRQIHPTWSNAWIKSAMMSTSKYMDIYNGDGSPAQPLDMGAGRLDLTNVTDPGVILEPPSLSFGQMADGDSKTITVKLTSVATSSQTYDVTTLFTGNGFTQTAPLEGVSVSPTSVTLAPDATATIDVTFDATVTPRAAMGDNQGFVILTSSDYEAHMPAWARVTPATAPADVLLIDLDFSGVLGGFVDYTSYYTEALTANGLTYTYLDTGTLIGGSAYVPHAAQLAAYKAVLVFSGDNFFPDGTFTVPTPLTSGDMWRLTEYANNGGIVFVMGQDASTVMNGSFFNTRILGGLDSNGAVLQDSVSGFALPSNPVMAHPEAPTDFQSVVLDLSGAESTSVALLGTNEVPPVATTMQGEATFAYNTVNNLLSYNVEIQTVDPVTLTGAHIHTGTAGTNGGVLFSLTPMDWPLMITDTTSFNGVVTVPDALEAGMLGGGYYVNIHTNNVPSGELRGQVSATASGDGAGNQFFVDELDPTGTSPDPIDATGVSQASLFQYPDTSNVAEGAVAELHRDQPTLEQPETVYIGRSIYTAFWP